MSGFDVAAACLVITALLAYLNRRFVKLPTTIGVMAIALLLSVTLVGLDRLGISGLHDYEERLIRSIDFSELLMQGMLSLLLFAGALHVNLAALQAVRWQVVTLALLGTLLSTVVVGIAAWFLLPFAGVNLPLPYCLVFGALISPTDPIAVLGVLKSAGAPERVELVIAGESLFNDGVGVVLFTLLLAVIASGELPSAGHALGLLTREAGGGILLGMAIGYATLLLVKGIDSYQEEVLLTLAAVLGGYALAQHLHVSGPIAMVVAGLVIGNQGRAHAMSDRSRQRVDTFWELVDAMLNSVLFVLIGLQFVVIPFSGPMAVAALVTVAITLLARWLSVGLPSILFAPVFGLPSGAWKILTWGGLRGGISVALALSLPPGPYRELVLTLTYSVVVFSILVQGLSMGRVVRRAFPRDPSSPA